MELGTDSPCWCRTHSLSLLSGAPPRQSSLTCEAPGGRLKAAAADEKFVDSEVVTHGELERPGATRAEEPSCGAQRLIKSGRSDVVGEARIVVVVETANVGDVEKIEDLTDELDFLLVEDGPGFGHAGVEGIEVIAELEGRVDMRERWPGMAGNLIGLGARGQRVPQVDGGVELSAIGDFAS